MWLLTISTGIHINFINCLYDRKKLLRVVDMFMAQIAVMILEESTYVQTHQLYIH